jgi:adiponectin receptor
VFALSATYHTVLCSSHGNLLWFRRLDFTGIVIGLCGATTPPFYYGFYCDEMRFYQVLWLSIVYLCCSFGLVVILSPQLLKGFNNSWLVAATMIVAGYSSSPGFLHMWFVMDAKYLPVCPTWTFVIAGLMQAVGAIFYSLRIPEKWFSKKFDYIGNSHNIFHTMAIIASLIAMKGSIRMYHER